MINTSLTLSQINELEKSIKSKPVKSLEVQNEVIKKLIPFIEQEILESPQSAFSDNLDKSFVLAFAEKSYKDFIKEKNRYYEKYWGKEILNYWVSNFTSIKGISPLFMFSAFFVLLYFVLKVKSLVLVFCVQFVFLVFIISYFLFINTKGEEHTYRYYFQSILYRNALLALLMLNSLFILMSSPIGGKIFTVMNSAAIALILTLKILLFYGQMKYFPDLLIKKLDLLNDEEDISS